MTGRGWVRLACAAWIAAVIAVTGGANAAERQVPASREQIQLSFAPVVEKAAPAVVNIYSRKVVQTRGFGPLFDDPFFRRFFGQRMPFGGPRARVQNSLGSGVIVDSSGYVVTNHHVVAGADEITVGLADRREFEARLIGSDEQTDLAVLQIDAQDEPLPTIALKDSDDIAVGDLVLAIGNPFGVGQTVTSGIVSGLARTNVGIGSFDFFIQTDAAINPGNSGGALVDMTGALVGINTAIYSRSGGSMGIGFAIPSNMVRSVIAGLISEGRLVRPWLGAWGQEVTPDVAYSLGMNRPAGVLINEVYPNSAAARAGVEVGDVILAIDGHSVDTPTGLDYRLATLPVGGQSELRLWRQGRETRIQVALVPAPEDPPRDATVLRGNHPLAGATVGNMSPALAEELGEKRFRPGVVVLALDPTGTASRIGFRRGDRIEQVNGEAVGSVRELKALLVHGARRWRITLARGDRTLNWLIRG